MDIIKLKWDGQEVKAIRKAGQIGYTIILPDVPVYDGSVNKRYIRIRHDFITYVSMNSKHIKNGKIKGLDEFTRVIVYSNGEIKYENEATRIFDSKPKLADKKVDEIGDETGFPYDIVKKLQEVRRDSQVIIKLKEIIDLWRKKILELKLRKFGYIPETTEDKSEEPEYGSQKLALGLVNRYYPTCDINAVLDELSACLTFDLMQQADPLRTIQGFSEIKGKNVVYTEPTKDVISKIQQILQEAIQKYKEEKSRYDAERDMMSRKREFIEMWSDSSTALQYAEGMDGTLARTDREWKEYAEYIYTCGKKYLELLKQSPENAGITMPNVAEEPSRTIVGNNIIWNQYVEQIRRLAQVYIGLNPEAMENDIAKEIDDLTQLDSIKYDDKISEVIEGYYSIRATEAENIFVIVTNLNFITQVAEILRRNPGMEYALGDSVRELIDDSVKKITDRVESIERARTLGRTIKKNYSDNPDGGPEGSPGGDVR